MEVTNKISCLRKNYTKTTGSKLKVPYRKKGVLVNCMSLAIILMHTVSFHEGLEPAKPNFI